MQLEIPFPIQPMNPAISGDPRVVVRRALGWCGHGALTTPRRTWGSESRHAACKACGALVTFHVS